MQWAGANARAEISPVGQLVGSSNYYFRNDPGRSRTNIPHFARVKYANIYPGIDLLYYGNTQDLFPANNTKSVSVKIN